MFLAMAYIHRLRCADIQCLLPAGSKTVSIANARIVAEHLSGVRVSVCLSVCLSVCPSMRLILQQQPLLARGPEGRRYRSIAARRAAVGSATLSAVVEG